MSFSGLALVAPYIPAAHTETMPLLERESALDALNEYADQARNGDGRLVLLEGEAGVGKSALLDQFIGQSAESQCLAGACDGLFTPRPLAPLFDIAQQLGGRLLAACRAAGSRDELFDALLVELSDPAQLRIVIVEDVHWADEATLDLLGFLARRIRHLTVMVVVTYRNDELAGSHPLRIALGHLAVQRCAKRLQPAPLSADAVRILAQGHEIDPRELHRIMGGNPFYVTEVIRAGLGEVPPSARDVVLARAARLDPLARETLEAAALIGTIVDERLLQEVAPNTSRAEIIESGLLIDHPSLRFRHEIARWTIEQSVARSRQAELHARIFKGLRGLGSDDDAQLAYHAEQAGEKAAALEHATLAGRRAREMASHREAAMQFERALRFATAEAPTSIATRSLELGTELSMIDRWPDAAVAYGRALEHWRDIGDRLPEGDTLRRMSVALSRLCQGEQAAEAAAAAMTILEPLGPSVELAAAYANLAADHAANGRVDVATRLARRAQELAAIFGAPGVQSRATTTEAQGTWINGGDWEPLQLRALRIALDGGAEAEAGFAYTNLHELHCGSRDFARAEPYFRDGVAYCEEHDLATYETCLRGVRTSTPERLGRWDESVAMGEAVWGRIASPLNRMIPMMNLGKIGARRAGDEIWTNLDAAMSAADGSGEAVYVSPTRLARAEAMWLEGDLEAARDEAEVAADCTDGSDPWLNGEIAAWLVRTRSPRPPAGNLAEPYSLNLAGDHRGAAEMFTALGCTYEAALALHDSSEEKELRDALELCTRLGAVATARIVRQKMRSLGFASILAGQRAATRQHPLGLTRREQEVLKLLCEGDTNAAIARKLVISPKTVDHHVSSVLAKLGVSKRIEVSAALARAAPLAIGQSASG